MTIIQYNRRTFDIFDETGQLVEVLNMTLNDACSYLANAFPGVVFEWEEK